jgi:hypothetical protein
MQPEISLGKNRTGIKASPLDAGELAEMRGYQLDVGQPTITAAELRASYMSDGETVGSVPPPTTIRGMLGATAQAFTGHRMHVLLDKLGERAAFERAGVRLYDAMLQKAQQLDRLPGDMTIETCSRSATTRPRISRWSPMRSNGSAATAPRRRRAPT